MHDLQYCASSMDVKTHAHIGSKCCVYMVLYVPNPVIINNYIHIRGAFNGIFNAYLTYAANYRYVL